MSGGQTVPLPQLVSSQFSGIVLVWSEYGDGVAKDALFQSTYIPRQMVADYGGFGHSINLINYYGQIAHKYIYVHNDKIEGHSMNDDTPNNAFVLRKVYGV